MPLWLWWWGPDLPDLATIWRVYVAQFSIEHTLRFFKHVRKLDDVQAQFPGSRRSPDLGVDPRVCSTPSSVAARHRSAPALANTASNGELVYAELFRTCCQR